MLARCDGESAEQTDGIVNVEAASNDQPLADTDDVLILFVFCFRAEGGVVQFRMFTDAEWDCHFSDFTELLFELPEHFFQVFTGRDM